MPADIKDYYFATPMVMAKFMKAQYKRIPEDIKLKYTLTAKVTTDNYFCIQPKKVMYSLKQAAILAYSHLKISLALYRYAPLMGTVGIWKQKNHPTEFYLCVDDFGI